jgi:hypothetical protein
MNIADIESQLRDLVDQPFDPAEFPFAFLTIYDAAKATVTKLRQGAVNQAKAPGDVLLKNKLFFRPASTGCAALALDDISADALVERHRPRFLIATDGIELYARDIKGDQTLDIPFAKLNDSFDFFLPLAGIERHDGVPESPADIKATGRLAKLYDAILEHNPDWLESHGTHELNLFMTRMLFCFFAEDTGIFPEHLFTTTVLSTTTEDGSDTASVLSTLFYSMDLPAEERSGISEFACRFPYVNGGLFREKTAIPLFSKRARRLFRECGDLRWREINPDIFGSMIQAVVEPGLRNDMGMHYTSVPNILKVLNPLFLISFEEEFETARDSELRLNRLLQRLYKLRIFDPACGSGNFLIIAYRELRRLELRIFERLRQISKQLSLPMSGVRLSQFFGIELADFAAETAKLSLWISEYQLNTQFKLLFGEAPPALPLREGGNIVTGNATRLEWSTICPIDADAEIYVVGNPPYLGGKKLSDYQAHDMVVAGVGDRMQLDYVCCWVEKASHYIQNTRNRFAFVTTSSICQGEQVYLIWPPIFKRGQELLFAHTPFQWANNAANKASVVCAVFGIGERGSTTAKRIYDGDHSRAVKNISPYLFEGGDIAVSPRSTQICGLPAMCMGSNPVDGRHLVIDGIEKNKLLQQYPSAGEFVKRYMGGNDLLYGEERYCLWISDKDVSRASKFPFITDRLDACRIYRLGAGRDAQKTAHVPHRFCYRTHQEGPAIIFPKTTSSAREYVPCGIVDDTVINVDAFAIYDPPPYVFGLLSSKIHNAWLRATSGRLTSGYRYSVKLSYNTFCVPNLSDEQKDEIELAVVQILEARERNIGLSLAALYDVEDMPPGLLDAHRQLDDVVERAYIGRAFKNDRERLEHLFKLYSAATRRAPSQSPLEGIAV